jgi:transposase
MGKKVELTEAVINQVKEMAKIGMNLREIATILGISEKTIHVYKGDNTQLEKAYKDGKYQGKANKLKGLEKLIMFSTDDRVRLQAMKYWLNCRGGFSEVHRLEHSGPGGGPIQITVDFKRQKEVLNKVLDGIAEKMLEQSEDKQEE